MPVDPQVREMLDQAAALGLPGIPEEGPAAARRTMRLTAPDLGVREDVAAVEDVEIPGPAGAIRVRLYRPDRQAPLPVVVFFHGGGWVLGDIETHDALCRALANGAGALMLSVDYRLAPEHKYPAAAEDAYAATVWAREHGRELGGDGERLAVCGDSAGGNLAAVVSLMARDRGGPPIAHQVLLYPVTDCDFDTASYRDNAAGYLLTRDAMMWFWEQYVSTAAEAREPYASPLRARDLAGLPPALVVTAEYDPLRDEGEAYARRLESAGVRVRHLPYDGMVHGFLRRTRALKRAREAVRDLGRTLRDELAR